MEKVSFTPTSRDSAKTDDIVLRETSTTRLVFRPLIVNNIHDLNAAVKGTFVFQRKGRSNNWSDYKSLSLSSLRADEWVKLELKSDELLRLVKHLNKLYNLHAQEGIPREAAHYIKVEAHIDALLQADKDELLRILDVKAEIGSQIFLRLLDWFAQARNREQIVARLESLEPDGLQKLNTLIGIGNLKTALAIWQGNRNNSNEEFWQQTLSRYSFVLSQIFSFPVIILKGKAYVGGKGIGNIGGNVVDFLIANRLTKNTALIEIKTPKTRIIGQQFRGGIFNIGSDVVGAVMQVSDYRDSLLKQYNELASGSSEEFLVFDPQCLVIAGNLESEKLNLNQRKSFELFRNGLKEVRVITYDELFAKVQILIDLLEGKPPVTTQVEYDDIPF
jgi:hypothetical protein